MMEEDIDIYADLSIPQDKSDEHCQKCSKLESQIEEFKIEVENLQKFNRNLELNISSLLLTAKGEVSRKDRMIADLRRQLDDASFRRGNFRCRTNYRSDFNFRPSDAAFRNSTFNPHIPPPPFSRDFKTDVPPPPPPPQDFQLDILSAPPHKNLETENINLYSAEICDKTEYTCNTEPYFVEDKDLEQKYDGGINRDTVFTKRLRKRLEEENELEQKEKERVAILEEAERKENEKLRFEETRASSSKINLDNKENRSGLVNKVRKRSRDYEETAEVKRLKLEPLSDTDHDNFREDWGESGSETVKIKEEPEFSNLDYEKKNEKAEESKNLEVRNSLAARLDLLSEGVSVDSGSRNVIRKDSGMRKEDEKSSIDREKERERYEKDRYENDKYKDKFLRERYEKDKYKEKLERERHERDKFDKEWYQYEREKFEKEKCERKFEKDKRVQKRVRRSLSFSPERSRKFPNKREFREKGFKFDEFYSKGKGRNEGFNRKVDLRQRISRPSEQESKYALDYYTCKKQKEIPKYDSRRSRSNSYERNKRGRELGKGSINFRSRSREINRREKELRKENFNYQRSRSNSKDKNCKDLEKKITLKDYKERRDSELLKGNSQRSRSNSKDIDQRLGDRKHILKMQKFKLEMKLSKFNSERSRSNSIDKDCQFNNRQSKEKDEDTQVSVPKDDTFSDVTKKSTKTKLEEGELSDSSHSVFPSFQTHETESKGSEKSLDDSGKNIENDKINLGKTAVAKSVGKSKVEKESKIENITNKLSQVRDSKSYGKIVDDDHKKLEILEKNVSDESKEEMDPVPKEETWFVSQLQDKTKISNDIMSTELCKSSKQVGLNKFSQENSDSKYDSRIMDNPENDLEKHVQTLDSFIESAKKVLEENKKDVTRTEELAGELKEEKLQEEVEKELTEIQRKASESEKTIEVEPKEVNTNKIEGKKQTLTKCIKDLFNPVKERKKPKRTESKEREEKKDSSLVKEKNEKVSKEKISTSMKENKKQKQNESMEEDGKEVSSPVKDKECKKQKIRETEIKKQIKEGAEIKIQNKEDRELKAQKEEDTTSKKQSQEDTKIKTQKREDLKNRPQNNEEETKSTRLLKELNQPESKKENSKTSNQVKDQREEIEPEIEASSSVKDIQRQTEKKEIQSKFIEAEKLKEADLKPKKFKKQVQKVKEGISEKPKAKKVEEKFKKIVVVVKRRRKPPVLSDCNASTTIVSNENVIMNIKLNNSGEKNLLS